MTKGPSLNSLHLWHVYVVCEGTNETEYLARFYWKIKAQKFIRIQELRDARVKAKNKYILKLEPSFYEDNTWEH